MSSKTMSTFLLMATILYATTSPLAHATFINFNPTTTLIISGRVCCTATGACLAATTPGVAGAVATLNCPPLGVVATTTTDARGNFVFNVLNLSPTVVVPTACTVTITLPLTGAAAASCPLLTGVGITGALVSPVTGSFSTNFGFPFFFLFPFRGQRVFNGVTTGFTITA